MATELCQNCHRANPVWFAPNDVWNAVVAEIAGILCPGCFINRAERQGYKAIAWILRPETPDLLNEQERLREIKRLAEEIPITATSLYRIAQGLETIAKLAGAERG